MLELRPNCECCDADLPGDSFSRPFSEVRDSEPVAFPLALRRPYGAYGGTRDWAAVDKAAYRTYQAGWITGVAGGGLLVLGVAILSPEAVVVGGLAALAGPAIMSGGSLRSARALDELGHGVSTTNGMAAWGFWGGSLGLSLLAGSTPDPDLGTALGVLSTGALVTSYVLATQQHAANNRGRRKAGLAHVGVQPVLQRDGGGVAVVGAW